MARGEPLTRGPIWDYAPDSELLMADKLSAPRFVYDFRDFVLGSCFLFDLSTEVAAPTTCNLLFVPIT